MFTFLPYCLSVVSFRMSWIKNSKRSLKRSSVYHSSDDVLPPGIKLARGQVSDIQSQNSVGTGLSVNVAGSLSEQINFPENCSHGPSLGPRELRTEAGELLVRHRNDGPWFPVQGKAIRGSSSLAHEIAASSSRRKLAVQQFESLVYAPNTNAGKESLFSLWESLCRQMGLECLPVTPNSLMTVAAIMRAAGYRSIPSYIYEVRSRHIRSGFAWCGQLDDVVQDIKRASKRALGPAMKAEEVKLDWWICFSELFSWDFEVDKSSLRAPFGGVHVWVFATHFLLREIELSAITLDSSSIVVDERLKQVRVHLNVQKNDPSAKGAWRTLSCACHKLAAIGCPFHAAKFLVDSQRNRTRVPLGHDPVDERIPLVGQRGDPFAVVDKDAIVSELQRFGCRLKEAVKSAENLDTERLTGHTFRRSGAKYLARLGVPFSTIQWMARHSSNITMQYVEEAWSEAPRDSLRLHDVQNLSELLSTTLARVEDMEKTLDEAEFCLKPAHEVSQIVVDRCALRQEIRKALIPLKVFNLVTSKLHDVTVTSCLNQDPRCWSTKCGWKWINASSASKPFFEADDIPADLMECERCRELS